MCWVYEIIYICRHRESLISGCSRRASSDHEITPDNNRNKWSRNKCQYCLEKENENSKDKNNNNNKKGDGGDDGGGGSGKDGKGDGGGGNNGNVSPKSPKSPKSINFSRPLPRRRGASRSDSRVNIPPVVPEEI